MFLNYAFQKYQWKHQIYVNLSRVVFHSLSATIANPLHISYLASEVVQM